jgi:hypothetical protein
MTFIQFHAILINHCILFNNYKTASNVQDEGKKMHIRLLSFALAIGFTTYAKGQTSQNSVDAAKIESEYWELQKKISDNKSGIATNQATLDAAATKALLEADKSKIELEKSKTENIKAGIDAEKAQAELIKGLLPTPPSPEKYKIPAVTAPKLAAHSLSLTKDSVEKISFNISSALNEELKACSIRVPGKKPIIFPEELAPRSLIFLSYTLEKSLKATHNQIKNKMEEISLVASDGGGLAIPTLIPQIITSLGETVASFAAMAKPQYAFDSTATTSGAANMVWSSVSERLYRDVNFVKTDVSFSPYDETRGILKEMTNVNENINKARILIVNATARAKQLQDNSPPPKKGAKPSNEATKSARLLELTSQLTTIVDAAEKAIAALTNVEPSAKSILDQALQGENISAVIADSCEAYTLAVSIVDSEVDTVARDSLFSSHKIFMGQATVAKWSLTKRSGFVASIGVTSFNIPMSKYEYEK